MHRFLVVAAGFLCLACAQAARADEPAFSFFEREVSTAGASFAQVLARSDRSMMLHWRGRSSQQLAPVYFQLLGPDGQPAGSPVLVGHGLSSVAAVVPGNGAAAGSFAVLLQEQDWVGTWLHRFDRFGVPAGAPVRVHSNASPFQMTANPEGDYFVVTGSYGWLYGMVIPAGAATSATWGEVPGGASATLASGPRVAVAGYLGPYAPGRPTELQCFDLSAAPLGPPVAITTDAANTRIAAMPDGSFMVAWERYDRATSDLLGLGMRHYADDCATVLRDWGEAVTSPPDNFTTQDFHLSVSPDSRRAMLGWVENTPTGYMAQSTRRLLVATFGTTDGQRRGPFVLDEASGQQYNYFGRADVDSIAVHGGGGSFAAVWHGHDGPVQLDAYVPVGDGVDGTTRLSARPWLVAASLSGPRLKPSARLADLSGTPLAGRTLQFVAGTYACSAVTDATGTAVCANGLLAKTLTQGGLVVEQGFIAGWAGDDAREPIAVKAPLVAVQP